ncbi:MAG: hypothetical protein IJN84_07450 [Clostridia bacterium]|nr:hypothetical protein [Clostridia bacterium]
MKNKDFVLETMRRSGKLIAQSVQTNAPSMSGTQLNAEGDYIPDFAEAVRKMNMLNRPVGFVCKSSSGRVIKLLQNYDSTIFTAEPEELPAQFGFVWSDDPAHARPFISLSTSPYMKGNVCSENDVVYRSKLDNNVWAPSAYPDGWEAVE